MLRLLILLPFGLLLLGGAALCLGSLISLSAALRLWFLLLLLWSPSLLRFLILRRCSLWPRFLLLFCSGLGALLLSFRFLLACVGRGGYAEKQKDT